ncbi:hypothetical protein [Taibaiella soli]|uniref:Protein SirB1 N-terminal domain-containing protein n=1 Tax=Taibaiella soli TaxID=1649169 RepID=A0A2W2AD88_9BACT|nr:hypothetical protein [Taibaiella soli]PZF71602.1 hypothetical protein DN068_16130 [Taibaiella soli]
MKKILLGLTLLFCCVINLYAQQYDVAFNSINSLLQNNEPRSFRNAVFITENVYLDNKLDSIKWNAACNKLGTLAYSWLSNAVGTEERKNTDLLKNQAIFQVLKDTTSIIIDSPARIVYLPYEYNFEDFDGTKDWRNTLVTTLLTSHKGNCHSMPYLYKIIADELRATCWLTLAPNHLYLRNYIPEKGWYNTELTNGSFPTDAMIATANYIPLKAIQGSLYMDTLSNQQSIALCLVDLAQGYERKTHNYYDGFILKCCDTVLKYHATNPNAMLLRAETLKKLYEREKANKNDNAANTYALMEQQYIHLYDLGYREMPEKMYKAWLKTMKEQQSKP